MIKKMEQAVKARDREAVRTLIVQELRERPARPETLDMVTYAIEKVPDLFDEQSGTIVPVDCADRDEQCCESLAESLTENFSRDRLKLYTDVCAALATGDAPRHVGKDESRSKEGYPTVGEVEQVVVEDRYGNDRVEVIERVENVTPPDTGVCAVSSGNAVEDLSDTADKIEDHRLNAPEHGKVAKTAGFVMMGVGAATAVVGLCISMSMLLGIGIALILVGSAVVYNAIRHQRR